MHCSNLDAYFYMAAQGDKEANQLLYLEFKKRAETVVQITMSKIQNFTVNPVDFSDYIDYLFFRSIREYEMERGSFSNYVDYVLKMRLSAKVQSDVIGYANHYILNDNWFNDRTTLESMSDPDQPTLGNEVAVENFKQSISSPGRYLSNTDRLRNKIIMMQYVGYSNTEICKELHITQGTLRGHLEKIKKDERVINFKLEMK